MTRVSDERALWLAQFVLPHEPALRAWLKRRRVVDLEVDDIVQETYAKLVALPSVHAVRDGKSYTFQVAYSIVVSHIRRARIVSIRASADVERLNIAAPDASPERALEIRDELTELARALATLPEKCRTTFTLRRVEGLSQREAAQRLGISEKTVEKHMARGIRLLMDRFGRGGKPAAHASSDVRATAEWNHDRKTAEPKD
jgi:RNA polymerase sigma-70 factor (ECF subfamily)